MNKHVSSGSAKLPACRLKFLFSSKGKRCVILRRGPSNWVRLVLWDIAKNEFIQGQWLNGPIRDFDISPNGDHIIYFVSYHKTRFPYLWVAISRPPYFSALAMWPISDAWGGSCAFIDKSSIYIEKGMNQDYLELSTKFHLKKYKLVDVRHDWDWKMKRNGWTPTIPNDHPEGHGMYNLVWKKKLFLNNLTLCFRNETRTKSNISYWLEEESKEEIALPAVDCADLDPYGRLIVARSGMLHIARIEDQKDLILDKIADFNDQIPENILAPNHARRW